MANDNNNINELVADDDDPTAELEIPAFARDALGAEADAKTFDADQSDDDDPSAGVSVSELKSDLQLRKKTISRLQYDIEQLHSKWVGLEAEIGARESQTGQLNEELAKSRDALAGYAKRIKKRDRLISELKSEIRQREVDYQQLQNSRDELQRSADDTTPDIEGGQASIVDRMREQPAEDLAARLRRTEEYTDTIRRQLQDQIESNAQSEREIESLSNQVSKSRQQHEQDSQDLTTAVANIDELQSRLGSIQSQHEEEIRILRFELGDAQNTVAQTEELNSQLESDLVDAQGFKDELERMLGEAEKQSSDRILQLEKDVSKLTRLTDSYEQKLTTKSEAISLLLAELAKKSEQIESIGEIEDVIQDIDERMSERSSRDGQVEPRAQGDRVSRVLIGTVDDQVLRFPLFKDRLTIGRTKDNDIQLKAAYISRRHAVIQTDGEITRIIDWGSKNGIQVNSSKVSEHFLSHGDTITIGNARFRYEERKMREPQ
jgi:pSer/pThr/pTyr-binding forkhead associated (FHA) protein